MGSLINAVMKVLTFVVVTVLIIILLPLVGPFVTDNLPRTGTVVGDLLSALWTALENIVHNLRQEQA